MTSNNPKIQMTILLNMDDRQWLIDQSKKTGLSYSQYLTKLLVKDKQENKE